ncbi:hypothetical protein ACEWPL_000490 [Roseovarius sp. S1116L3]|uniref:hypothetical protein n=1 Tax=Roseovarius roseus TaxID=3342636 RepID=UPI00372BB5AF
MFRAILPALPMPLTMAGDTRQDKARPRQLSDARALAQRHAGRAAKARVGLLTTPATPPIRASSGLGVAPSADIRTEVVKIRTPAVPILWKLTASDQQGLRSRFLRIADAPYAFD